MAGSIRNLGKVLLALHRYDQATPRLRGGFFLDWTDDRFDPVRRDPRFIAVLADSERLQPDKPTEKQWTHNMRR